MHATVLLIDDDPMDLRAMQMLLEGWGLTVAAARSGAEAMALLEAVAPDLVVSDVRMPGMDGEAVAAAVTQARPGLPVLLVTGHGDIRSAVRAMKAGAADYIVKPPDEDELRLAVERAVVLSGGPVLGVADFRAAPGASAPRPGGGEPETLTAFIDRRTREHVLDALERTGWRKGRAAARLGVDRATLYRMLRRYRIERGETL